jgi:hypothetical protein
MFVLGQVFTDIACHNERQWHLLADNHLHPYSHDSRFRELLDIRSLCRVVAAKNEARDPLYFRE